jgi:hypothetical protein
MRLACTVIFVQMNNRLVTPLISLTEIGPVIGGSKITKAHLISEILVLFTPQFTSYCISMQECTEAF